MKGSGLIVDQMLGRTARWCRALGIDTVFFEGEGDSALLAQAKASGRIVVTRDIQLASRCKDAGVGCVFVKSLRIEEQLAQIVKETGLQTTFPQRMRCASCNGMLERIGKSDDRTGLPPDLTEDQRAWRCQSCGKAYWEGGHWKNLVRMHGKVMALISA